MYLFSELSVLPLLALFILWGLGGWLMVGRLFELEDQECGLIGFGVGLVFSNALANFLARILPLSYTFWVSAILTLGVGVLLTWPVKRDLFAGFKFRWSQWLWLALGTFLFTLIGRGLAIFDDFQNLPTLSLMATGDIPPHFPLTPDISYGYHYFLILLAVQFMHVGNAAPWTALDLARGLSMALTLALVGLSAWRLSRNRIVSFLSIVFVAFSSGTRWLLLLVPVSVLRTISNAVTLIGSGRDSASNLFDALALPWRIAEGGPIPFPFAFANGVNSPLTMSHNGTGTSSMLILLLLLLTADRRRSWLAGIPIVVLLASLALASETDYVLLYLGFALAALFFFALNKKFLLPRSIIPWIIMTGTAGLLALVQGGFITEVVRGWFAPAAETTESFFRAGFKLVLPQVISSHLGVLSLIQPWQLLAAIFEVGPVLLALPLVFRRGVRVLRDEKWQEAALIATAVVSGLSVFIEYFGNAGITATTRLLHPMFFVAKIYAVPLAWGWLEKRRDWEKVGVWLAGITVAFGGAFLFGIQLVAAPRPVYSYFLTDMDARFQEKYWDQLSPGAWVFDPYAFRSPTIFGRPLDALKDWAPTPEWEALVAEPDPYQLQALGYDYMYFDKDYQKGHSAQLDMACVEVLEKIDGEKAMPTGTVPDFRMLVEIDGCK